MPDQTLDYFLKKGTLKDHNAADIQWYHAANSKDKITEALQDSTQMIEADVLLRGRDPKEPIMAHPPDNDSDITLRDWLKMVANSDKGIKLDFKSLEAVVESMALLDKVRDQLKGPVWINADILPGPGGTATPLDAQAFLQAVAMKGDVLSLGWTTGWSPNTDNPGGLRLQLGDGSADGGSVQEPDAACDIPSASSSFAPVLRSIPVALAAVEQIHSDHMDRPE